MRKIIIILTIIHFFSSCVLTPCPTYAGTGNGWSGFLAGLVTGGCLGLNFGDPYKREPSEYIKSGEYKKYTPRGSGRWHRHNRHYIHGDCGDCHFKKGRDERPVKRIIIVPPDSTIIIERGGW